MAKQFGNSERKVRDLFSVGQVFVYNQQTYKIEEVGKPTCQHGEPKTDVYVKCHCFELNEDAEFKISFKQQNADFLENKMSAERAEQLFGPEWSVIISRALSNIIDRFKAKPLIYKTRFGKTDKGAITLGWKFELLNVESGALSGSMNLSREQLIDVYAGTNLATEKRNAAVNGVEIKDSGIANFILFEDDVQTDLQSTVDCLESIESYIDDNNQIFFACKALNYRTIRKKYDGNRPLAVYIDWSVDRGKLKSILIANNPLQKGGTEIANKLIESLNILGIDTTDDIDESNVVDVTIIYQ